MEKKLTSYDEMNVNTADQGKLILMAYEGTINFIKLAKERLSVNDFAGKSINISNAVAIINELRSRIDIEKGGETAKNLDKLYIFISMHLTTANLKKDVYKMDEAISILENLYNGWVKIIEIENKKKAQDRQSINIDNSDAVIMSSESFVHVSV
ncbi:MAG: flagellar export chaperone FliS [Candidatus Acididesulfobacter diazotrophicus]|jgi:flagellar protein FliS|uniref:Flagellar secretion chaperone FliS n=1 Tax=Candidatus Acididesulfobacter diazotrophicus TaxID=2597226 RepID=A0A519BPU7_9DELT|nr:MAG: flagellar export chaperone FliS [Candidatus Acididesulfobacter diazotrophicus]